MKGILKSKKARRLFASVLAAALLFVSSAVVSFAEMQTESTEQTETEQAVIQPETALAEQTESEQAVIQPETALAEQTENEQVVIQPETAPTEQAESEQAVVQPEAAPTEPAEPSESLAAFLAAIEKLSMLQEDDAPAEEVMAAYEEAIASYDALSDGEKALEEVAAAKEALDWFYNVMLLAGGIWKASGFCGYSSTVGDVTNSVKWEVRSENGRYTLIISGKGKMADWSYATANNTASWSSWASSIHEVQIEAGVTSIGKCAFKECKVLDKVTIPAGVDTIGSYAFENCINLKSVTIPDSVKSIGSYAFNNCSSLTEVNIPTGVTRIASGTFSGCSSLTQVEIPQSVTSMGGIVFMGCSNLREVRMNSAPKLDADQYSLFSGCKLQGSKAPGILMPADWDTSSAVTGWTKYSKNISTTENDIHPTPDETGYDYTGRAWVTGYEGGKVYHWKWCVLCVPSDKIEEANRNPEAYANKRAGLHENGANSYGCKCSERSIPKQSESMTPPTSTNQDPPTPETPKQLETPTAPTETPKQPETPTAPTETPKQPETPTAPTETPTAPTEQPKQTEKPDLPKPVQQPQKQTTPEPITTAQGGTPESAPTAPASTTELAQSAPAETAALPTAAAVQTPLPVDAKAAPIADSSYEYPTYQRVTPDPNDPNSPEVIVVLDEDDVPSVYRKTVDPDNSDNMIYIEDPSVPLAGPSITEKTGNWMFTNLLLAVMAAAAGIMLLLFFIGKRRNEEEEREDAGKKAL